MNARENRCYPAVVKATPNRAVIEARILLDLGRKVAVIARSKARAKPFENLRRQSLLLVDYDILTNRGFNRAAIEMRAHLNAIFLLRDSAAELSDDGDFIDEELALITIHLLAQLEDSGCVMTFPAFDQAANVLALHPR